MEFSKFKQAIAKQFAAMCKSGELFYVNIDKDALWEKYLASFPEGSNPIYRERTEHDCSCCKQFIRAVGHVVAFVDGRMETIWDIEETGLDSAYITVANDMANHVAECDIENVFRHYENMAGADRTFEQITDGVKTWEHFFVNIPPQYFLTKKMIGPKLSEFRSSFDVSYRGFKELKLDAIDTVLELIAQGSLYRGEESKAALTEYRKLKAKFDSLDSVNQSDFAWINLHMPPNIVRMRNTAMGTLLVNLSNDMDLEAAVRAFEVVMAPHNYKRPTALVTKAMVENARNKIAELGLTSALDRRFATLTDIDVNNIIFANRETKSSVVDGDVFDSIQTKGTSKSFDKVESIGIEEFIKNVVPTSKNIEILLENKHAGNLVSMIAPTDPTANRLFKWDNGFSWTYNGDMADSIKERVKKAGGNVTGDLCCRLSWFNFDDLDLHMIEPNGNEIYFGNKYSGYTGGQLDVDMNAFIGQSREAVENIFYQNRMKMTEGLYVLYVNQYNRRETVDVGFEVEIDYMGEVHNFTYDKAVVGDVTVAKFRYSKKDGIEFVETLPKTTVKRVLWGLETTEFHPVDVMMLSPNYWNGHGTGNKHYFFMLRGCQNDGTARGFYNEFLSAELNEHRKVLEMVGSKVRAAESNNQLSGLGFSSTQNNEIVVRVTGSFTRVLRVTF